MLTRIIQFFSAPVFASPGEPSREDEERTRVARLLNIILHVTLGIPLAATIFMSLMDPRFWKEAGNWLLVGLTIGMVVIARWLMHRGQVGLVSAFMSLMLWVMVTVAIGSYGGVQDAAASGYLVCIIIAGLLLGGRAASIFTALSVGALVAVWLAQSKHLIVPPPIAEVSQVYSLLAYSAISVLGGLLLRYAADSLNQAVRRARENERAQIQANRELQAVRDSLEVRVAERTRDLERHSRHLEAATEVGHAASSILIVDQLIRQVVELICERFDLYHVSLFTLDETGRWLVFRAGTGEASHRALGEGFRLQVGSRSMVGWCAANGRARVAQDVRAETERVDHPLLSDTRSEVALPLIARGQVIGALNAQSSRLGDFDRDAVAVLQTMADQIAVALDNARLFAETQQALEAERRAYGQMGREAWAKRLHEGLTPGYRYVGQQVAPIGEVWHPEMDAALHEERSIVESASDALQTGPALATPIKVRGQAIGVVDLHKGDQSSPWTPEEMALVEALTDQLGVALDSARLFEETQRAAVREQLITQIATKVRAAPDVDGILRTTVQEIRRALGVSHGAVHLKMGEQSPPAKPAETPRS